MLVPIKNQDGYYNYVNPDFISSIWVSGKRDKFKLNIESIPECICSEVYKTEYEAVEAMANLANTLNNAQKGFSPNTLSAWEQVGEPE